MDDIDFAQSMKRSTSSSQRGRSVRRTDTSTVYGTAMTDSIDGSVRVDLGGSIIGGDGMVGVTCPTTVTVRKGDTVLVQLVGARGTAQSPIVVGCVGRGDVQQGEINEAKEEADEAKTAAEQAKQSAKDAADAASDAQQSASDAADAAQDAIDEAGKATKAAGDAMDAATTAGTAASNAMSAATSAGTAASNAMNAATAAGTAARGAVAGLGQVQDVLGTLDWIRKHGTYALTEDTTVDPSKVYYTRSGTAPDYTYAPVAEPRDEELATYYELSVDEALAEFVGAHLALMSDGLHVVSDTSGYYVVLGNDAMRVYDPQNTLVATYGATVQIGRSDESHIEMDFNSFKMVDKDGVDFFVADDLRDETGVVLLHESFTSDGTQTSFRVMEQIDSITKVTVNGTEVTNYTFEYFDVKFATPPENGANIVVWYYTRSIVTAYTFGQRRNHSVVGINSIVAGDYCEASGRASYASGYATEATSDFAHAEGYQTNAHGEASHAEGWNATASGRISHVEGTSTASGHVAHAEGTSSTASGDSAHAEGYLTTASEWGAHSEGGWTQASGARAHAEGSEAVASGDDSHAEGERTAATSGCAHAEGFGTVSSNIASHSEGYETKASGFAQHVEGQWNVEDTSGQYAHIIGNGTDDNHRSNAYTVDWDGNVNAAGNVNSKSLQGRKWDFGTANTSDTWVPVATTVNGEARWQHRAIPTDLARTPVSLWSGNTNANITLSQTVANFKRVTIFYRDNDNLYSSVDVYDPLNKSVLLTSNYNGRYIKSRVVNLSGTAVNSWYYGQTDAVNGNQETTNLIYITKVLGWYY